MKEVKILNDQTIIANLNQRIEEQEEDLIKYQDLVTQLREEIRAKSRAKEKQEQLSKQLSEDTHQLHDINFQLKVNYFFLLLSHNL